MITVKYFASLKESMGRDQDMIEADSVSTVKDVWFRVVDQTAHPANMLVAVNMEYATMDHLIKDGDEVAFFPPVTGG